MIISYPFKRTHRSIIVCKLLTLRCMFTFLLNAPNQQSTSIIFFVFNLALSILNKLLGFLSFFFFLFFFRFWVWDVFISTFYKPKIRWWCVISNQPVKLFMRKTNDNHGEKRLKSYSLVVLKVVCVAMLCLVH